MVRAANGVTIQVIHTDAEGRMVLADTLALAARTRPRLMHRFRDAHRRLRVRADRAHERRIHQPAGARREAGRQPAATAASASGTSRSMPDFDSELESKVADVLQCAVDGKGDHILAARFLQRFVPTDMPWVHVDLSSATRSGGLAHVDTEITGFGVRFALELLLTREGCSRREPQHDRDCVCAAPTTGTCTCATAPRCARCCRSPRRASRAPSSCPTSRRR